MKLVSIGFGNVVAENRIVAVVVPDSSPVKRIIQDARDKAVLVDATYGRKTRSVIITDCDHVILSALPSEKISAKIDNNITFGEDETNE